MESMSEQVVEARDAILSYRLFQPEVAIILGSGLADLANHAEHASAIPYSAIPHFPNTNAAGHPGQLIFGFLGGLKVVLLQGRAHRYEGWSDDKVCFPTRCLQALGARTLVITNAAGGLNPRFRQGELMLVDEHLDLLWGKHRAVAADGGSPVKFPLGSRHSPYDLQLLQRVRKLARQQDTVLHQGCYLATLGPTYETRAEYRMFRWMGADAVGMSTIPEVLTASQLGMRVMAISVITNVASTDAPQATSHVEVVETGKQASERLTQLIVGLLDSMSGEPD